MKSNVHFTDKNENFFLYKSIQRKGSQGNAKNIEKMKKILYKAIKTELTDTQRLCLTEHFLNGKKQKEIAEQLGISRPTVSKHISAGKEKLRRIASYYEC